MKYINKQIQNEPETLRNYRNTTPDASYIGFVDTDDLLIKALLHEQGHLCGYCMKRIKKATSASVEHYISQKKHPSSAYSVQQHKTNSLLYPNMLAVCVNDGKHCDKSRGNIPFRILNPHHISCEQLIQYTIDGDIKSHQNVDVSTDIETLKLNCQPVKDSRNEFWKKAKEKLKEKHPKGMWTRAILEAERQQYIDKTNGKYEAYCNYIVYHFNRLLSLPKYNN